MQKFIHDETNSRTSELSKFALQADLFPQVPIEGISMKLPIYTFISALESPFKNFKIILLNIQLLESTLSYALLYYL
jgi:hypothetical protein